MTVRLRNIAADAVSLYRPAGDAGSLIVEPGQECEIPGEHKPNLSSPDGIVIGTFNDVRAFSTQRWELVIDQDVAPVEQTQPRSDLPPVDADVTPVAQAQPAIKEGA